MTVLSSIWSRIQSSLFPYLEDELGELSDQHRRLIGILEVVRIEENINFLNVTGRPVADRAAIARAFVAKSVYNLGSTRALLDRLRCDPAVRRICGWESRYAIPSESTFSRAFGEFARGRLPEEVHARMTERYLSDHLVGHISRDSTEIIAREKPVAATGREEPPKRKRGRPKKGEPVPPKEPTRIERQQHMTIADMLAELPTACDRGCKTNSKGYKESWNGYKLHLDVADGHIPITSILTSASLHDSQAAIPLAALTAERVTSLYDLMDSAYDCDGIRAYSQNLGHVPVIEPNCRRGQKRCFDPVKNMRYNERTTVERVFGRLKDEFGGRMIRVRGSTKVMAHLMFGILALTADHLLKFVG
jgi:hypothetical protein